MSKNFEREYREYLNAQAPDLWDRIESGIEADSVVVLPPSAAKPKAKSNRKKRARYYRLIASLAACVAALCLIVPVYRLVKSEDTNKKSMAAAEEMVLTDAIIENTVESGAETAPAGDSIPQPFANTEMPPEAAESPEESTTEEVMAEAEVESMAAESGQITDAKTGAGMATNGGSEENMGLASDGKSESPSFFEGAQEEMAGTEEQLNVEVTILAEEKSTEEGIVYEAVVADSAVKELKINETVRILLPNVLGMALKEETSYVVILQQGTSDADYTVVSVTTTE